MLIILCGLPASGKTTISRLLARRLHAALLRVDTIEQAVLAREPGLPIDTLGYDLARRLAADNLAVGMHVIADCVNPVQAARDDWKTLAQVHGAPCLLVSIHCCDPREHQRRVESRMADIDGHQLPSWAAVKRMRFEAVLDADLEIDTALTDAESAAKLIAEQAARMDAHLHQP